MGRRLVCPARSSRASLQAEMQLLLLVPLLLASAAGSSVSAALCGPGGPCLGDRCRRGPQPPPAPFPGGGHNLGVGQGPGRWMGWVEASPQPDLLLKEVGRTLKPADRGAQTCSPGWECSLHPQEWQLPSTRPPHKVLGARQCWGPPPWSGPRCSRVAGGGNAGTS